MMTFPLFLLTLRLINSYQPLFASEAQKYQPLFADFLPIARSETQPKYKPSANYNHYPNLPNERQFRVLPNQKETLVSKVTTFDNRKSYTFFFHFQVPILLISTSSLFISYNIFSTVFPILCSSTILWNIRVCHREF